MSNRYQTEKEKAGTIRRMTAYRAKLAEKGLHARQFTVSDDEYGLLQTVLLAVRKSPELMKKVMEACDGL